MRLLEALAAPGILLGDGAYGTELAARGYGHQPCELANLDAPDLVRDLHAEYVAAGAQFLETNTFGANRFKLIGYDVDVARVNRAGADIARRAAGKSTLVLGAIGPAGKPIEPIGTIPREDVVHSTAHQAASLAEGGVDGFILETFIDLEELAAAVEGIRRVSSLPIVATKAYIEDGEALAGGVAVRCAEFLDKLDVAAVGANCVVGPQRMLDIVRMLSEGTSKPIVAMPTPGMPMIVRGQVVYGTEPGYFAQACLRLAQEGVKMLAGCCGATPAHIAALRKLLDERKVSPRTRPAAHAAPPESRPSVSTPPTRLWQDVLDGRFVVSVELDVPRGLRLDPFLESIRSAKAAGANVVNISDGARARLRINPMAMCHRIQSEIEIETTMHFSCRDRNLLAIQADLLGCHALGVRNILAVTGDPANIGDFPSATSVFDVDSVGLARILSRLNEGIDLGGYTVGVRCGFTICVAFNPTALDSKLEFERLARKKDAGAQIVYTQPVFDEAAIDVALESCARHGLPVFVGVMPLRSSRHAEFMHNEVPGIRVPDRLRALLANAESDEAALELGLAEAERLIAVVRQRAQGLYLMPPAQNVGMLSRLIAPAAAKREGALP